MNKIEYHSIIDALNFQMSENEITWKENTFSSCYEANIKNEVIRIWEIGYFSCNKSNSGVYSLEIQTSYNSITRMILIPEQHKISDFNDFAKGIKVNGNKKEPVILGDFKLNSVNFINEIPSCYPYLQKIIKSETEWFTSEENVLCKEDRLLGRQVRLEKVHIALNLYSYCISFSVNDSDNLFISSIPHEFCETSPLHDDLYSLFVKYFKRDEDERTSFKRLLESYSPAPDFISDYMSHRRKKQEKRKKEEEFKKSEEKRRQTINDILSILKQNKTK
ncbi:hypothetical protein [uncultured Desulfobacter sp.]|uniref:hypothetical protein n=1 Tax=uncultured Desulfobacter sp. TaxID=240139 RepID=UPI0029F45F6A|nr:hypothetical protein [uncultured Desulfobacter sp.]